MSRLSFNNFDDFYKTNIISKVNNDIRKYLKKYRNKINTNFNLKNIEFSKNYKFKVDKKTHANFFEFKISGIIEPSEEHFELPFNSIEKTLKDLYGICKAHYSDLIDI